MREWLKKVGSLALALGSLALLLGNAALAHGCGGSRATGQATNAGGVGQSGQGPAPAHLAVAPASGEKAQPKGDDPCNPPSYMYATKAPIFVPESCYSQGNATGQQAPPQQAPPQQAPAQAP